MAAFQHFRRDGRGTAAIEFAVIAPVLIFLILGTFEVGRFVRAGMRVSNAAASLADLVAQQTNLVATDMTDFCNGSKLTLTPLPTTSFQAAVASVTYSKAGVRASDWQDTTCGPATAMTTQVTLATPLTPTKGDSAIVVTATYTYTLSYATVFAKSVTITRIAFARPRAGTTITHS